MNMVVFRAGCDSRSAVKSASKNMQNWCDSNTDSIVWMKEDVLIAGGVLPYLPEYFPIILTPEGHAFRVLLIIRRKVI